MAHPYSYETYAAHAFKVLGAAAEANAYYGTDPAVQGYRTRAFVDHITRTMDELQDSMNVGYSCSPTFWKMVERFWNIESCMEFEFRDSLKKSGGNGAIDRYKDYRRLVECSPFREGRDFLPD